MKETINHFIAFLEFNPGTFSFGEDITYISFQFTLVDFFSFHLFFVPNFFSFIFFLFSLI